MTDGAEIVRNEIVELAKEGVSCIQFDEGFIGYLRTDLNQAGNANIGDREAELERDIALENSVYDAVKSLGVTTAMHMCRGSRITHQKGGGTYDWLAERLFGAVHVDRFLLEYDDTERVGGYEPLRHLPKGKIAVLGIVSSKDAAVETRETLLKEIERAAKFCPIEQLALTTQCGFQGASDRNGAHVSVDIQKRKLARIAEVAHEVWG